MTMKMAAKKGTKKIVEPRRGLPQTRKRMRAITQEAYAAPTYEKPMSIGTSPSLGPRASE